MGPVRQAEEGRECRPGLAQPVPTRRGPDHRHHARRFKPLRLGSPGLHDRHLRTPSFGLPQPRRGAALGRGGNEKGRPAERSFGTGDGSPLDPWRREPRNRRTISQLRTHARPRGQRQHPARRRERRAHGGRILRRTDRAQGRGAGKDRPIQRALHQLRGDRALSGRRRLGGGEGGGGGCARSLGGPSGDENAAHRRHGLRRDGAEDPHGGHHYRRC